MPGTTLPGFEIIPAALLCVVAERMSIQFVELDLDGAREARARRLGQDAKTAVERLVVPGWSPEVIGCMNCDTHFAGSGQIRRHGGAHHIHLLGENRVYVRLNRIQPWRDEDPRRVGALLVNVIDNLRMPHVLNLTDGRA